MKTVLIVLFVALVGLSAMAATAQETYNTENAQIIEIAPSSGEIQVAVVCNGGELQFMNVGGGLGFVFCELPFGGTVPAADKNTLYLPVVAKGN